MIAVPSAACCYFPAPPSAPPSPAPAPIGSPSPPAYPTPAAALDPIAPPLEGGREHPLLGLQLLVDVPDSAREPAPVDLMPAIDGALGESFVSLGDGVSLGARDLPCAPSPDLAAGAVRELERRHPALAGSLVAREVAVRDATLAVVEVVPQLDVVGSLADEPPAAWFLLDVGSHVALLSVLLDPSWGPGGEARARARVLAESIVGTMRRGSHAWVPALEGRTYGDLFDAIDAPAGWVLRSAGCCNEEPPYVTRFRESVIPLRPLGGPPRARVTARNGPCPPGVEAEPGTMLGRPMRWTRTATGRCWVERPPDGVLELGVSWHVRGERDTDLVEALGVAATARRDP